MAFLFSSPEMTHSKPAHNKVGGSMMNSAVSALPSSFALSAPVYSSLTRRPNETLFEPDLAEKRPS